MDMTVRQPTGLPVRPNAFFVGATEGVGIERDAFGRVTRRFRSRSEGRAIDTYRAVSVTESHVFDDGHVDLWHWVISAAADGRYVASEIGAGAGIISEAFGDDLRFHFRRGFSQTQSRVPQSYAIQMTMLTPETLIQTIAVSRMGVPLRKRTLTVTRCAEA